MTSQSDGGAGHKVHLRAYTGKTDRSVGTGIELTLEELVELNRSTVAPEKGQLPMLGGTLLNRKTSDDKKAKVPVSFTAVFGDHDSGTVSLAQASKMLEEAGVLGVVMETASSTAQHPRWRVVAPTSRPFPPESYVEMVSLLNSALEGALTPESWSAKQGYYYGHLRASNRIPDGSVISGAPIDLLKLRPMGCRYVHSEGRADKPGAHLLYFAEFNSVGPEGGEIRGTERPSLERVATSSLRTGDNLHAGILAATTLVARGEWPEQFTLDAFTIAAKSTRGAERSQRIAHEWAEALEGARRHAAPAAGAAPTAPGGSDFVLRRIDSTFSFYKPIEWTLDGFLAWGITVIAGAPGVGKTSQIVGLAMLVAHLCAEDHPMRPVLRRRIVYVTEDAFQVEAILVAACKLCAISPDRVRSSFLVYEARRLPAKTIAEAVAHLSSTNIIESTNGFRVAPLVVLDTSSATFAIADENDNATAAATLAEVKQVLGSTPLWLVAHTPKSLSRADVESLTVRGAGAFEGDANATAFCFKEEGVEDKRFMKLGKVRYDPEFRELMFTSELHTERVDTPWGATQIVRARISYPEVSSSEEREVYKEAAKQVAQHERNQTIVDDILAFLEREGPSPKSAIEKAVAGKASTIRAVLATLVTSGVLEIRGSGNKQRIQLADTKL